MRTQRLAGIDEVSRDAWNALVPDDNPFLRHEFLACLERSGSVTAERGWTPCHAVVTNPAGALVAASPLYVKHHSYGEYVFDFAWAQAAHHAGIQYYPKLIAAVPFSPVTGPRMLVARNDASGYRIQLLEMAREIGEREGVSSIHWLFVPEHDSHFLSDHGYVPRTGFQYHWSNPGYRDFDDFLSTFTADKRKKVKRDRRRVSEAGIEIEIREGRAIDTSLWDRYYEFYVSTIEAHGGTAYLTREFFHGLGDTLPDRVRLAVARRGATPIAGALFFEGTTSLYGRYWGTTEPLPGLHFETCYYAAIEYCVAHGLTRFEAGAQGEHKLARGFVPVATHSAHWVRDAALSHAVGEYLRRERSGIAHAIDVLSSHAPFKQPD